MEFDYLILIKINSTNNYKFSKTQFKHDKNKISTSSMVMN